MLKFDIFMHELFTVFIVSLARLLFEGCTSFLSDCSQNSLFCPLPIICAAIDFLLAAFMCGDIG